MYECPNCGGNLKFDIPSQQLACAYCNAEFDPYSISKEKDAEEDNSYEVTVFTCPQCGGEIYSMDNTAAGFCSFCGASTILDSRLKRQQSPGFIIPFKKTKTDCKKAYAKTMKYAIFAPKELKDEKHIDSFRGIYMPYWIFDLKQQGDIVMHGKKEKRRGDYIIISHYNLHAYLDAYYKGLSYDASSSFADNISERIAPFDVKKLRKFVPSYLSGFYADTSDVESRVYKEDAIDTAVRGTKGFVKKRSEMKPYELEDDDRALKSIFGTETEGVDAAMFPVWFLSYRNKDRVAYATVNGQTGKVVADLPVDIKKYMTGSLLLAIPIFFLLNMIFTVKPTSLLITVSIISFICIILHLIEMNEIKVKENYEDDKGALEALRRNHGNRTNRAGETKGKKGIPGSLWSVLAIVLSVLIIIVNPVSDLYYYGGAILSLGAVFLTLLDLIKKYNVLATRRLPQFDYQGGDDRA
ncbi:MAG: hypothetical protein K2K56_15195 [Lachnospiraceae bacterium]|nr:hypothetical protein [Lachnospiraceae bacterium]